MSKTITRSESGRFVLPILHVLSVMPTVCRFAKACQALSSLVALVPSKVMSTSAFSSLGRFRLRQDEWREWCSHAGIEIGSPDLFTNLSFLTVIALRSITAVAHTACSMGYLIRTTRDAVIRLARPLNQLTVTNHVFALRQWFKMVNIDAAGVFAFVVKLDVSRQIPMCFFPQCPVHPFVAANSSPLRIPAVILRALPFPAVRFRIHNVAKRQAVLVTSGGRIRSRHLLASLQAWGCDTAQGVTAPLGFSLPQLYHRRALCLT
jgi:hypothetical protein